MVQNQIQQRRTSDEHPKKEQREPRLSLIPVKKDRLVEIVKENRDNHRKTFEKALEGYHSTVVEELEKRIEQAKARKELSQYLGLEMPKDHTDDYDTVLRKLDLTEDEIIYLDNSEVENYIMDNWSWKQQFSTLSASYIDK